MLFRVFLFSCGIFLTPLLSLAQGGWISSGGELFRDGKNPWFVRNTKLVTYCIQIDSTSFSATEKQIENAISEGFEFWQREFSNSSQSSGPTNPQGFFDIGTQTFLQKPCTETVDIRFLFGIASLADKEKTWLGDPKKYIGVTVRTDYDLIHLKAKGFVYFSSDIGPYAYDNPGSLIEKAWENEKILSYAVLHELGHIFGVPHMGTGLMSEVFLNQILNKTLFEAYKKNAIESFLKPPNEMSFCNLSLNVFTWYKMPAGHKCIHIDISAPVGPWIVFSSKDLSSQKEVLGEIKGVTPNIADIRQKPVSILELGQQQTVFSPSETAFRSFMIGPMTAEFGFSGIYLGKNNQRPQSVYGSLTPTSLSIQTQILNTIETIFVFNSPLSLLFLVPPTP